MKDPLFEAVGIDRKRIVKEELAELLAAGRTLSRATAKAYADLAGVEPRTIYRWSEPLIAELRAAEVVPGSEDGSESPVEETFLDRVERLGKKGFVIDRLFLTLYYLCDGRLRFLHKELTEAGYRMPSYSAVWRALDKQSEFVRDAARHGFKNRTRKLLFIRRGNGIPNEAWELDEFILRINVHRPNGATAECSARLLLLIDWGCGLIRAWRQVPDAVKSSDLIALFAEGCETQVTDDGTVIGGKAQYLVMDNAQAFRSYVAEEAFKAMESTARLSPGYSPEKKGKVERTGQTIEDLIIAGMPGRKSRAETRDGRDVNGTVPEVWLSWKQALDRTARAVYRFNHVDRPKKLGGQTRFEWYVENSPEPSQLHDAILAEMYPLHPHRRGVRIRQKDGVPIDGWWWTGTCLADVDEGDEVLVGCLHPGLAVGVGRIPPGVAGARRAPVFRTNQARAKGEFLGWVKPSTEMTKEERDEVVNDRNAAMRLANSLARDARKASARVKKQLDAGEAADLVAAASDPTPVEDPSSVNASRRRPRTMRRDHLESLMSTDGPDVVQQAATSAAAAALGLDDEEDDDA